MTNRIAKLGLLAMFCTATLVLAAGTYWWEDGGFDDDWDTNGNWDWIGSRVPYPSGCGDDAIVVNHPSGGDWTIGLIDELIEDFSITEDVAFSSATGGTATLTVESLVIEGPAIVTLDSDTKIDSGGGCP